MKTQLILQKKLKTSTKMKKKKKITKTSVSNYKLIKTNRNDALSFACFLSIRKTNWSLLYINPTRST